MAKAFHRKLAKHFNEHGYEIDDCSDLARVYRVLMSYNHKYGQPRRVEVLAWNPELRVNVAALPVATTPEVSAAPSDKPQALGSDHDLICQHCSYYCHMTREDVATASEPDWLAAGASTACCVGGREQFHVYSARHPQYSQREADQKFDHIEDGADGSNRRYRLAMSARSSCFSIWADPHMLTVSETLYTQIEKVAAKNKPTPFHISGRGHLASNLHPNALEVKVRRSAPTAVPAE